ncbi:MAG: hydantoinase/oxoprolinase family protein [Pseudomonadota bacterium]
MPFELAADIGGTFTDVVLRDGDRQTATKVLTTYEDPANGVMQGIEAVLAQAGREARDARIMLHGTTLATNALIERRGAVTALLTTAGHRDAVEMALENRFEQYDVNIDRPAPLVGRALRLPVAERLDARGETLIPLDEASVRRLLPTLEAAGVESVAVGLLHAYANGQHEARVRELLLEALPDLSVSLSSEVCPEIREYERLSTTCANAYVKPLMDGYLESLSAKFSARGFRCPILLMTSGGGLTTLAAAREFPIRLVESGPAGGAILAAEVARALGAERTLSFDMGGTTAKLCVIDDGEPLLSRAFEVDRSYRFRKGSGLPVRIPVIEMVEIGAGGGSLAAVDGLGRLKAGPESAGSEPGPACYGRGGETPAVTDADVLLGRLNPDNFAGGSLSLDVDASEKAIATLAAVLRMAPIDAAHGVSAVVNENMAAAARAHLSEWGRGTEQRTLIAFGGAAPLHACALATALKIERIIVPANAGVGSAVGFLLAPVGFEVVRSHYMTLESLDSGTVTSLMTEMQAEALAVVGEVVDGSALSVRRRAFMRYLGQGYEIAVDLDGLDAALDAAVLRQRFEDNYKALYGRVIPGLDVEVLSWTLNLVEAEPRYRLPAESLAVLRERTPEVTTQLYDVALRAWVEAGTFARGSLDIGDRVAGPALIREAQTTVVVAAAFNAVVAEGGSLVLERSGAGERPGET